MEISKVLADEDFRKYKLSKCNNPIAYDFWTKEAEKAGITLNAFLTIWCARGSQGLEANWLKTNERQSFAQQAADIARSTVPAQHSGPDPVLLKIEADRQKAAPMPAHIRQQINSVLRKV